MFTFSPDAFIVWTFESGQSSSSSGQGIPHIFSRYNLERGISACCHLQDNSTIVMGDKEGGVEVYNFQSQKIQVGVVCGL